MSADPDRLPHDAGSARISWSAPGGVLPREKVGRAWRFLRSDLLNYPRGSKRETNGVAL